MMAAYNPGDVHLQFFDAYNRGDLETLVSLYEEDSILASPPRGETGAVLVQGTQGIREQLKAGLSRSRKFTHESMQAFQVGDIALLHCKSVSTHTEPDGTTRTSSGGSIEIVRRQADGTWRYVIDYPGVS